MIWYTDRSIDSNLPSFTHMYTENTPSVCPNSDSQVHAHFFGIGGGPIFPAPVSTFLFGGNGGGPIEPLLVLPPVATCVNVPPLNHLSSSAFLFLLNSACIFGSTSSRPCTGVNESEDAVPAPAPNVEPTPEARSPLPRKSIPAPAPWPKPRRDDADPPTGV